MLTDDEAWLLFRSLDDADGVERPPGFDTASVAKRFDSLVLHLNASFSCDCPTDTFPSVQDASFYGDVVVPAQATKSGERIVVRVSNFGSLAIYDIEGLRAHFREELLVLMEPRDRKRVDTALARTGHVLVPSDPLEVTYDGVNTFWERNFRNERKPTWFIRYFDYV